MGWLSSEPQSAERTPWRSLWLQQVAGDAPDAPPLHGAARADVAILGGGFVGLRTAIRIKELDPACDVAVLEQDICGSGASGRNGGFVLSWWPKLSTLVQCFGESDAVRIARDSEEALRLIGAFCATQSATAEFEQRGWLWTATSPAQLGAWDGVVRACERLGVDVFAPLPAREVAQRCGSPAHLAGVFDRTAATVQPAALARSLRQLALTRGVRIYEHTKVLRIDRHRPLLLHSSQGALSASKLVIATNAWATSMPELRRFLAVVSSDIVATAPIGERLRELGWSDGEAITDSQMRVAYYRTTRDGRIVFGKGGGAIAYDGRIGPAFDRDARRAALVADELRRSYPSLRDAPITHDWCGPIDRSPDGLPLLGHFPDRPDILYGVGWSGNGVGPSVIGANCLASLALGQDDDWARYPLVQRDVPAFPPSPFKYVGARVVRSAVARKERAEMARKKPARVDTVLARLAPAGLEDKN